MSVSSPSRASIRRMGAAFAALAVGLAPTPSTGPAAQESPRCRRTYGNISRPEPPQPHLGPGGVHALRAAGQLPRSRPLSPSCSSGRANDGGWSLKDWAVEVEQNRRTISVAGPAGSELAAQADGYRDRLIVYALRQAGVSAEHETSREAGNGSRSRDTRSHRRSGMARLACATLSITTASTARRGAPWRRLFMSDAATAFATLGLLATD